MTVQPFSNLMTLLTCLVFKSNWVRRAYLDGVVELDVRVGESDGSAVVSDDVGHLLFAEALANHLAQLEASLVGIDLVGNEAALDVVENSKMFICFVDGNHVHLAQGEAVVTTHFAVNLDKALLVLHDFASLVSAGGVLQALLQEDVQGNALSQLVGTGRGASSVDASEFAKVPLLGSSHSLNDLSLAFVALTG
jgi:hypothetical protein